MRCLRLAAVAILLASAAHAQSQFVGSVGIYDDPVMTENSGIMDGPMKSVWVGMPVEGQLHGESTGYEFSILGLDAFTAVLTQYPIAPSIVVGDVAAPPDTTMGTGGLSVAWAACLPPGQAFLELRLFDLDPPQNHVLRVLKRFPPSNPDFPYPRAATCDAPCFCTFVLRGETYILNPTVAAEPTKWTAIKSLYRQR